MTCYSGYGIGGGGRRMDSITYSLCFFFGPGLPRALGSPFAAAALRLTPFFLGPSTGGPIDCGTGVPPAAGVGGLESDAISGAGMVVEVAGDSFKSSLTGVSSLGRVDGATMARSFRGVTLSVTTREAVSSGVRLLRRGVLLVAPVPDLRLSFVMVAVLLPEAISRRVK